jgi:hypothetical protein
MMNKWSRKGTLVMAVSLVALLFTVAPTSRAQNEPPNDIQNDDIQTKEGADPPSRVARVSFLDGSVSMQPGGTGDWGSASINRPVTIGDKLWTDQNSRVELQAGEASIHLGGMTALSFLNLDGNATQMRLAEGRLNFRVREIRAGDLYEVDTPNLAFTVKEAGAFRIDVNENGDTTGVTVIRGEGEVATGGQTYTVHAGERASITGTDNSVQYNVNAAPLNPDDFDKWAEQRDLREENSKSAKYVSRDVVGYSDLDDYGEWSEEPTYGHVWYPNSVSPDWAPYSNGYWSYVGPWGWTWVDYSPWGFAPFHYGRWNYFGGRWGWCPGPIYGGAVYGPAFVGFLGGFHGGFGFGVGIGVGWFPLGWGEPYRPWYHCGNGYWNRINVHNTYIHNVNINRTSVNNYQYAYAHNTRAVTVASHNAFANGQAINRNNMRVNEAALRGAHVTNGADIRPTHASYLGATNTHGRVATPSNNIQNRAVVARTAPAAGASHLPVHTMNTSALRPGQYTRPATVNTANNANNGRGAVSPSMNNRLGGFSSNQSSSNHSQQTYSDRPPTARPQGGFGGNTANNSVNSRNGSRPNSAPTRTWNAQGNTTDSGRGPQGFGGNRPTTPANTSGMPQSNRPPSYSPGNNSRGSVNRPPATYNDTRSYRPPSSNNGNINRGSSAPRSYNPSQNRSYSPPTYNGNRGSSAPRSYSPPPAPRSSGGAGGGGSHPSGGGGGSSHPSGGGGGSSHPSGGGGGGGSHPHR